MVEQKLRKLHTQSIGQRLCIINTILRNFQKKIENKFESEVITILTCKLGNEIINCYDGTHDKEQLKKWAEKKILLCPVCNKPYEYCHGKIKTPYFRHMEKMSCDYQYNEPETEEHLKGKRDLFEWIKKQPNVKNAVLEGWIPETKQRPDIMFEYKNKQYVIEYQCSPIATEYTERHELYKAVGIHDIWICGTQKYLQQNMRKKFLKNVAYAFYSSENQIVFPIEHNHLFGRTCLIKNELRVNHNYFYGLSLGEFSFDYEIFNKKFGKPNEVIKKMEYRKNIRKNASFKKEQDYYLFLQNKKLNRDLDTKLYQLSNNNWKFYIMTNYSKYKSFEYILAEPVVSYNIHKYDFHTKFRNKKYKKIMISKMDYSEYKRCCRDIEYLKRILYEMMIENKRQLMKYTSENIRFLEVLDN